MASSSDPRSSSSASQPDDLGQRPSVLERRNPRKQGYYKRMRLFVGLFAMVLLAVVLYVVVVFSPIFEIKRITCNPTEHLSSELISQLAAVPEGSTLFNVDEGGVAQRLEANPWVASVSLRRNLPSELVIEVQERTAAAVVMLANGSQAWLVSTDGYWLGTVSIEESTADNGVASPADQAKSYASAQGLVYVSDVSALVKPDAGTACDDAGIQAALAYLNGFSDALRSQVATVKAASAASTLAVLKSGIEVSLGTPTDIAAKEKVILALLEEYAGRVTYINVRTPSTPTLRALSEEEVAAAAEAAQAASAEGDASAAGSEAASDGVDATDAAASAEATEAADDGFGDGADEASDGDAPSSAGASEEAGPGGSLDEGGYYGDDGEWVYYYHDPDSGELVYGYYDSDGTWISLG